MEPVGAVAPVTYVGGISTMATNVMRLPPS